MVKLSCRLEEDFKGIMYVSKLLTNNARPEQEAREAAQRIAREVLSNPVIEDYQVEIEA